MELNAVIKARVDALIAERDAFQKESSESLNRLNQASVEARQKLDQAVMEVNMKSAGYAASIDELQKLLPPASRIPEGPIMRNE